jgi:hypothetical protein
VTRIVRSAIVAASFIVALGASLALSPSIIDRALALDSPERQDWRAGWPAAAVESRIAALKTAIKITDDQSPAWESFVRTVTRQARDRAAASDVPSDDEARSAALSRLEDRANRLNREAAEAAEMLVATKTLYASLSDAQKQAADGVLGRGLFDRAHVGAAGPQSLRHGPITAE